MARFRLRGWVRCAELEQTGAGRRARSKSTWEVAFSSRSIHPGWDFSRVNLGLNHPRGLGDEKEGVRGPTVSLATFEADLLKQMPRYEALHGVRVVTYCIMTNHFHVLVEISPRPTSEGPMFTEASVLVHLANRRCQAGRNVCFMVWRLTRAAVARAC